VTREYRNNYKPDYKQQIEDARIKLERLQLLREISEIDSKLRILEANLTMYPPQEAADDEKPLAVHSAPIP
jgi:hypothetical protein